ncbi:unnamed protein product [Microthlaspi erraticum]|uniref:DUF4283 domain-containing protein n=1 Tax=Microthlaspi erraticum TaxID=1685480 RepID=A0A6D2JWH1_9BRAS|nr:unnamed protein product [Microthlaspi erraticum]
MSSDSPPSDLEILTLTVTNPGTAVDKVVDDDAAVVDSGPSIVFPKGAPLPKVVNPSSVPLSIPSSSAVPYASRIKVSLRNLRKMAPPTYLDDGTSVVQAPESLHLKASEMWKDHIISQFHGLLPPASVVFANLNPIWASLELPELVSASTWVVLKNVPPMLYSLDGISVITSAIGEPLHA